MKPYSFYVKAYDAHVNHQSTTEVIRIEVGESGFYPAPGVDPSADLTPELVQSAVAGSMFGWTFPHARPAVEYAERMSGIKYVFIEHEKGQTPGLCDNDERADRADEALTTYCFEYGEELQVRDLLCDLMHLCDRDDIDFDHELEMAEQFYGEEEVST